MQLKLKPVEPVVPDRLFLAAELTSNDTIKIVISDIKGRFVIEKTLTKMEAQILRARGTF